MNDKLSEDPRLHPIEATGPRTDLNGLRILVAEDESMIALDIETMLRKLGCEVVGPVPRVRDIIETARTVPLDGALLDVNLRGAQVFEALPHLQRAGVPVILASGYDDANLFPPQFSDLPRITKPFNLTALEEACLRYFRRPPSP